MHPELKDCKLPGKRHTLQALVVSVPEAQGLQAARQTSRISRTASCQANVTLFKLWLPQGLQAARQTSRSSRTASCQANVTLSKLWLQAYPKLTDCRQTSHKPYGHHIDALPGNVMLQQDTKVEHRGDVVEDDLGSRVRKRN